MEIVDDIVIELNVLFRVWWLGTAVADGMSYDFPGKLVLDEVERRRNVSRRRCYLRLLDTRIRLFQFRPVMHLIKSK